ncbi:MAG: VOC family protein [Pirellulales bacterium]
MKLRNCALACAITLAALAAHGSAAEPAGQFARSTIDLGVLVSDLPKSVKFYTEAIGFGEAPSFSVAADYAADAGLTDHKPLEIRVLVLGNDESATKLKLMSVPGASKKNDNGFIHSELGYRYLTIFVADADAAHARLKKAGVKPLAKGPLPLPAGFPAGMSLAVVRDPDGNLIELIGPTKAGK